MSDPRAPVAAAAVRALEALAGAQERRAAVQALAALELQTRAQIAGGSLPDPETKEGEE